jgi:single-strand DNA-binding protein
MGYCGNAEMRKSATGMSIFKFSLATTQWRKSGDEWESETDWFNIVVFADLADRVVDKIEKGTFVYVDGRMRMRKWEDDEGKSRTSPEVLARTVVPMDLVKQERREESSAPKAEEAPF